MSEALLLAAAKRGLAIIEDELGAIIECHCVLDGQGEPLRETLDPECAWDVGQMEACIEHLRLAIAAAEARGVR